MIAATSGGGKEEEELPATDGRHREADGTVPSPCHPRVSTHDKRGLSHFYFLDKRDEK